ncbi:MAG TPA: lanthionine synthetase C family protein [Candidatus Acidoferrum sp.]|nr:lanthionine synthetase C family protein [Candidatus Acidoferrum sp.]
MSPATPDLSRGSAGLALFFSLLGSVERAVELLTHAVEFMPKQMMTPGLYDGFTGVAWAVELLRRQIDLGLDDDVNDTVDEALAAYVARTPWRRDYDLISGLAGIGVYALERKPSSQRSSLLACIVDRLSETSTHTAGGITWHTPPELVVDWQRELYPDGYYNLGLSHGVPGVIALLGRVIGEGIAAAHARTLLDGAVSWLLSVENPADSVSRFGTRLTTVPGERRGAWSRVSWCYGDLGIAAALLSAARHAGQPSWEREALRIARHAAGRPVAGSDVLDAGICHGAAGNGHLFNRLYQATGDTLLLEAARGWFERALAMRRPGQGVAGYLALRSEYRPLPPGHPGYWDDEPGFLKGAAGIGLALLVATTSVSPEWDRILLAPIPLQ